MTVAGYELRSPQDAHDWQAYHAIRRYVLFERRGQTYDDQHPDEFLPGHHAFLLKHAGAAIGVIRIDVDGTTAIFRRVAILEEKQRLGHGRTLLYLAESFALTRGCNLLYSFVAPDAVGFYQKCGFEVDSKKRADAHHVPMQRRLV